MDQCHPASQQKLPAGLAGVLNHPEEQRDSAYFSNQDPSSKHNSTQSSNGGGHVLTPPSSGYQSSTDKTPSPINTHHLHTSAPPLQSPTSGSMSVASMVSPTTPASADAASMHQRFSRQSYEAGPVSAGGVSLNGDPSSRRESVNSQLGLTFGDMRLASSPYASNNQSTTSIQSTLQQQRNPGNAPDRHSATRFPNSYQPNHQRLPEPVSPKQMIPSKTAPTITGPALGNIARAPEPTKGQAWAFPEEEVQRLPSAARPSGENVSRAGTSYLESRRSSMADSVASSQFTTESRLPPGQRRLDEGLPADYHRLSRASSEFQGVAHHHHSLQHKQLSDLQGDRAGSPSGSQPYSRTPELRVSHKLAERKRRTEMKELFENLRDLMPQERGSKASKWEILTKAIAEHQRMQLALRSAQDNATMMQLEAEAARREASTLRSENGQLRTEIARVTGQHPPPFQTQPEPPRVNGASHLENGLAGGGMPTSSLPLNHPYHGTPHDRSNRMPDPYGAQANGQLPPLRNLNGASHGPQSMDGVQYQNEPPRVNGFPSPNDPRPNFGFAPQRSF